MYTTRKAGSQLIKAKNNSSQLVVFYIDRFFKNNDLKLGELFVFYARKVFFNNFPTYFMLSIDVLTLHISKIDLFTNFRLFQLIKLETKLFFFY